MLRCTSERENVEPLLVVHQRLRDIDSSHYEYELSDPSKTGYYQYHQDDVDDLFRDTGVTSDELKPIADDEVRELYQSIHDHTWRETNDGSMLCIHCKLHIPYPDDDGCPDCGHSEKTSFTAPQDEVAPLVCMRHGTVTEVEAVGK